jgi:Tfp pilus assembly protein PilF
LTPGDKSIACRVMTPQRRLSHARGFLELGLIAEAAGELAQIPAPHHKELEVVAVRLAILQEQKDWPALRDLAAHLVGRAPGEAAGWVTWAYATRRADSLEAAKEILLAAERHHPDEPTIQFNLGCYACQRGDLESARRRVDRAIALDPKFKEAAATDPDLAPLRQRRLSGKSDWSV